MEELGNPKLKLKTSIYNELILNSHSFELKTERPLNCNGRKSFQHLECFYAYDSFMVNEADNISSGNDDYNYDVLYKCCRL